MEVAPKKTYVGLRRKKQFAIVQPSTKTRLDIGLNLKGLEPTSILEPSGSFNIMCTHRIRITDIEQFNEQVQEWLKLSYEGAD